MTPRLDPAAPWRGSPRHVVASLVTAVLVGLGLSALAPHARAQEDVVIATDRPDFTETPFAIEKGRAQIEAGYTREAFGSEKVDHAPELLVRTGFLPYAELRLGYDRAWLADAEDPDELSAGVKVAFDSGAMPWRFAVIGAGTWANQHAGDLESDTDFALELIGVWSREISSRWAVGGIAGGVWDDIDDTGTNAAIATVSAMPLGAINGGPGRS